MLTEPGEHGQDEHVDFPSFVSVAVDRVTARLRVDSEAMRLVLTLHRVTAMLIYDLEASVHRPRGWSWAGFRLLFVLWVAGPVEAGRAAELSGMSRPGVSALLNTLQKRGLVSRRGTSHDGRAVVLALTDAGTAALDEAFSAHNAREQLWSSSLSPSQVGALVSLLDRLLTGMLQHTGRDALRRRS